MTESGRITFAGLDTASRATAARLIADGVERGDRVALLAPNGVEWAVAAFSVMRLGAVLVPLSTLLRPPELLAQLQTARVNQLIVVEAFRGRDYLDDLEGAAPGLRTAVNAGRRHSSLPELRAIRMLDDLCDTTAVSASSPAPSMLTETPTSAGLAGAAHLAASAKSPAGGVVQQVALTDFEDAVSAGDEMVILFTSGSRGAPKGVIHSHGGAIRATEVSLASRCIGPGTRVYIPMPFFWVGGFGGGLMAALVAGATLLSEAEAQPASTLAFLARERATLFRGWPDQAARLAAEPGFAATDLSELSDATVQSLLPAARRAKPGARANLFGMTESFGPYCGERLDLDMPEDKWGSCGRPFADVEVRVVDPVTQADVSPGEPGELWLRGPTMLTGICGRTRAEVFTPDGCYRTGDLGRRDDDGYIWFDGRLDDMFKVRGATVYPSEVEAALRAVPGVRQVYVTDVAAADGLGREVGALVITAMPPSELDAAVRQRLSAFKVPRRWVVSDDPAAVPMLPTGKPDKAGLQQLISEHGVATETRAVRPGEPLH